MSEHKAHAIGAVMTVAGAEVAIGGNALGQGWQMPQHDAPKRCPCPAHSPPRVGFGQQRDVNRTTKSSTICH